MTKIGDNRQKIIAHLSKDPVMRKLVVKYSLPERGEEGDLFQDLVETILLQQLSDKIGEIIVERFRMQFKLPRGQSFPTPRQILGTPNEKIRRSGTSSPKISYIKGVCRAVLEGNLDLTGLRKLPDEDAIKELVKLKGIGQWSAEMILMFTLRRPDVFSVGDLGLRTAVSKLYGRKREDAKAIEVISRRWKPYRTFAARLLWKSLGEKD